MGSERILTLQGHPDPSAPHLCHALEAAYAEGATQAGRTVRRVDVAKLDFPLLRSQQDWEHGTLPPSLLQAQEDLAWASHLVLFFPLWLGDMPALFKGFLEQVARPGFAFKGDATNPFAQKGLKGKSARVVVTLVFPCAQRQIAGAQHPGFRRGVASPRDTGGHGRQARPAGG
jgi:putative NADPH-quinone reductase